MQYKVVPVITHVLEEQGVEAAANQLESLINEKAVQGWKFLSVQNIEIIVTNPGTRGCFGIGATPETTRTTRFDMAVFEK